MKKIALFLTATSILSTTFSFCVTMNSITIPVGSLATDKQTQQHLETKIRSLVNQFDHSVQRGFTQVPFFASKYPVDVTFMIADIKFDGENLKILEFGEGTRSRFRGFDGIYGAGSIWSQVWKHLATFNLPMWYVGTALSTKETQDEVAFAQFSNLGGNYCLDSSALTDILKQQATSDEASKPSEDASQSIEKYKSIALFRHRNVSEKKFINFKKDNPETVVLNYAAAPFVNNKFFTNTLFEDEVLKDFKPLWKSYPKKYSPTLAQEIINDISAEIYVIKPLNACKGYGIIMTEQADLDFYLENIIKKTDFIKNHPSPTYSYWAKDHMSTFIVERFERSKTLYVDSKPFEPTLRVVFILDYNNLAINLNFLGSYWKLASKSLTDEGTLDEKTKSSIDPKADHATSLPVAEEDYEAAKKILSSVMPRVYIKMLQTRHLIP